MFSCTYAGPQPMIRTEGRNMIVIVVCQMARKNNVQDIAGVGDSKQHMI